MISLTLVFYSVLFIAVGCSAEVRQERAKIIYSNPKYIANLTVFTRRVSRREPYRTNLTGTLVVPYGNNVTTWRDLRSNVKRKAAHNRRELRGSGPGSTGNGPSTLNELSEMEEQVLDVMGPVAVYGMEEILTTEFALILQLTNGGDFKIQAKACDTLKTKWMQNYMSQFTNVTLNKCPIPVGRYAYINMELPPKNVPIPVMDGDYYIIMELFVTATKEKIMVAKTLLHVDGTESGKADKSRDRNKDRNKDRKG